MSVSVSVSVYMRVSVSVRVCVCVCVCECVCVYIRWTRYVVQAFCIRINCNLYLNIMCSRWTRASMWAKLSSKRLGTPSPRYKWVWHSCEWVMSHITMSHVTHTCDESCLVCTYMRAWLIHICDMTHSYVAQLICTWHDSFNCDIMHS